MKWRQLGDDGGSYHVGLPLSVPNFLIKFVVSVRQHGTAGPIFTKFLVHVPRGPGSVLLWRRCDMLYTSGFADDVTCGRNGQFGVYQNTGVEFDVY